MLSHVMMVHHLGRPDALTAAQIAREELEKLGVAVFSEESAERPEKVDLVLAMGGDGTILAAAERARAHGVPLLGINMGHMGFLAEASAESIPELMRQLVAGNYSVDSRMTLDIDVHCADGTVRREWALNDAVVKHTDVAHPVHIALVVDGQDVSTYGADGMILATPTGSTAYSFSAGGPVVWPDMEAIVMSPLAAHGLFTRPLVVGPSSTVEIVILEDQWSAPEVWCDGLRQVTASEGTTIVARVGKTPVRLVRLENTPFATRLVTKFNLPVRGWRSLAALHEPSSAVGDTRAVGGTENK